jgi:hypothetical protein
MDDRSVDFGRKKKTPNVLTHDPINIFLFSPAEAHSVLNGPIRPEPKTAFTSGWLVMDHLARIIQATIPRKKQEQLCEATPAPKK